MPVWMALLLAAQHAAPAQDAPDAYNLPIGRGGTVMAQMGFTDTRTGKAVTADDIAAACDGVQYLLVGESHATPSHHKTQADLMRALAKRGRHVSVGLEMFTRDHQLYINGLSYGTKTIEEFETASDWKTQWGHSYAAYRPVMEAIRDLHLPMVALNVPRAWVSQASKQGYDSFDEMQRKWVPMLDLTNKDHEMVFDALLGGHPPAMGGVNIYAGQVTWDTGMAKTALDWRRSWPGSKNIMVIMAGAGHVMYGQGIAYRMMQLEGAKSLCVVCVHDDPRPVRRGLADYAFVGELPPAPTGGGTRQ
ncbi:MAG: ChaN family lipoprotein [Armatimonadetes bacterium]|nr:ChaN family lipoprotein [Armatimonadota bacterium]MBX3108501.1 ChaN family lipoprotein [Fimbriimonadaceae bacterium]